MNIPKEHTQAVAEFPPALQALIQSELAAGNRIVEITSGFPAPPVGACLKLARPVTTRLRASDNVLQFYERNHPDHSGEFTDAKGFFFVLEPPLPPEPEPDMNAIRAEREARQRAADAALRAEQEREAGQLRAQAQRGDALPAVEVAPPPPAKPSSVLDRFRQSMEVNYERWHDGVGYDLDLLKSATPEERAQIEQLLLSGGVNDWRDVEALTALDTPRARAEILAAIHHPNAEVRAAVTRCASELIPDRSRVAALVRLLREAQFYGGLSQALDEVEAFHPPEIVETLLQGALEREGEAAVHFAAMLTFVHGQATEPFDMSQRPFFLRFNTEDRGEREAAFRELCAIIGTDASRWLTPTVDKYPGRE